MSSSHLSPVAFVRPLVDAELAAFVASRRPLLLEIGAEWEPVLAALEAMISGGKRLRPAFCYWGWRGAGGGEEPGLYTAAAALELLQACGALIHDDVIDNSDTRRGSRRAPRLAALHRESGWHATPTSSAGARHPAGGPVPGVV